MIKVELICDSINPFNKRISTFLLTYPRFIHAEMLRHRMLSRSAQSCLDGDSLIYYDLPSKQKGSRRICYIKLSDLYDKWHNGAKAIPIKKIKTGLDFSNVDLDKLYSEEELSKIFYGQRTSLAQLRRSNNFDFVFKKDNKNVLYARDFYKWYNDNLEKNTLRRISLKNRLENINIRSLNEETKEFYYTKIKDVIYSGLKDVYEITLKDNYKIRCTLDHKLFTEDGWKTLNDFGVLITSKKNIVAWNKKCPKIYCNGIVKNIFPDESFEYLDKEWLLKAKKLKFTNGYIAEICNTTEDRVKKSCRKLNVRSFNGSILRGNRNKTAWNKGKKYKQALVNLKPKVQYKKNWKEYIDLKRKRFEWIKSVKPKKLLECNYKCVISGRKDNLQLHHIDPVWHNLDRAFDETNIVVLNKEIHRFIHKNNLDLEFLEYFNQNKELEKFLDSYKDIKFSTKDINKPVSSSKFLGKLSKIIDIKYIGQKETYDLEVVGPYNNFVADGVVVHNSRAIPVQKIIKSVEENPVIPLHWGLNQSGMQAFNEVDKLVREKAIKEWLKARDKAVEQARELSKLNIHKQIVNRILEPFSTITEVVTGTDWGNFFNLRVHKDAQPEIKVLAIEMLKLYDSNTPKLIEYNDWHLPFIREEEFNLDLETRIKVSFTRCARASYINFYGKNDIEADVKKYDDLVNVYHLSPSEHQAQAKNPEIGGFDRSEFVNLKNGYIYRNFSYYDWLIYISCDNIVGPFHYYYSNFDGWSSRRKSIKGENRRDFNKEELMRELNEKS